MSTRKANFVSLDELMDEVGSDVNRFFFEMRNPNPSSNSISPRPKKLATKTLYSTYSMPTRVSTVFFEK